MHACNVVPLAMAFDRAEGAMTPTPGCLKETPQSELIYYGSPYIPNVVTLLTSLGSLPPKRPERV